MNPDSWVEPAQDTVGTFTIAPGSYDTAQTSLGPFTSTTHGQFYTSTSSRSLSAFGYSYPEIQDWLFNQSTQALQQNVTAAVNELYNPSGTFSKRATIPPSSKFIKRGGLIPGSQVREWSVQIQVSKFDLNGSRFMIRLFLGDVPEDSSVWATSSACVGSFAVLPPPHASATGGLPNVVAYDEVSLVQALEEYGYNGEDESAVVPFLTENLVWRIQNVCFCCKEIE